MKEQIEQAISSLSDEMKAEHSKALSDGHKDEICPQCKSVFLAHHHFVRCNERPCAMSNGKTFLEMLKTYIDETN